MTYVDGFVIPVPKCNKSKFIDYGHRSDEVFVRHGASRIFECWQDNVARGALNDFFMGVDARDDEVIAFSWIEWRDKATRDQCMAVLDGVMKADPHFDQTRNPLPFDGGRMLWGRFQVLVERGEPTFSPYVQGIVLAVPESRKEDFRRVAEKAWETLQGSGALRMIEAWEDEVPAGGQTDFFRMVMLEPGEKVVFSFIEWPSREACDAASLKMKTLAALELPFDCARVISGGFRPVVEAVRQVWCTAV